VAGNASFRELIRRVRAGEQDAAAELVRQYEPEIRRAVRCRLDSNLGRLLDSMDVCQSVLSNFFVRVAAGQFDLREPSQLLRLLVTMARNRVLDYARKAAHRQERTPDSAVWADLPGREQSPSQALSDQELLQKVKDGLSEEERAVAERRAAGLGWADIGRELGASAEAVRKKFSRALDRVTRELGLQGAVDGT
jgi:RNA polymerase sigma-70 factor (ECF subfamily)